MRRQDRKRDGGPLARSRMNLPCGKFSGPSKWPCSYLLLVLFITAFGVSMRFGYYKNAGLSRSTFVSKYVNTSDALIFTPQSAPLGSEINLHAELPMSGLVDNIVTEIRRGAHDQTFQCLFNFIPGSKDFMRRLNNTTYIASQASSRIWRRKMVRSSKETEDAEVLSIECEPPTSFPHPCLQPACKHPVDIVVAGGSSRGWAGSLRRGLL